MKLPDDIRSEINRQAHALSQASFVEHRRRLVVEAAALLKAGSSPDDVLQHLALGECDQYAQAHSRASVVSEK